MTRRGAVLFAAMSVIWGVPYLFIRVAVRGLEPAVIVSGRMLIAAAVLLPLAARAKAIRPVLPGWRWLVLFAVIEMAIPWYLLTDAERHLPSSLTGLLLAAVPLVSAVISLVGPTDERLTGIRALGLGIGLAGVVALIGIDLDLNGAGAWPVVEVMLVAVCYAVGPVIVSRRLAGLPGLGVSAVSLTIAAALYLVPGIVLWPSSAPPASAVWSVVVLGLVCTALAFVLFYDLIGEIGPSRATVITYLNPAVALVLGVVVLDEQPTVGMFVGFPLVLLGSVLATRGNRRAVTETSPAGRGEAALAEPDPASP
jgi:drug/metabolite transporter (DMT)-like permease